MTLTSQETYPKRSGLDSAWIRRVPSRHDWRRITLCLARTRGFFMRAPDSPAVTIQARPSRRGGGVDERDAMVRLTRYLERLAADGFFGKVTVSFQNGRACDVKIEQTHKLDEL